MHLHDTFPIKLIFYYNTGECSTRDGKKHFVLIKQDGCPCVLQTSDDNKVDISM